MKPRRLDDEMAQRVVAYCEAIEVPDFDEKFIAAASSVRVRPIMLERRRPITAALVAAMVGLLFILCTIPAVIAGVQRVFGASSVDGGRTKPMTIRATDLERARADMPFAVIAPPPIAAASVIGVNEVYADSAASDASVVFEIHGTAPGSEVMIIESDAARNHGPTVFASGGPSDAALAPELHRPESLGSADRSMRKVVLRGVYQGHTFAPASWVIHGTRIAVLSPPGFLSTAQLQTIRRVMSR